MSSENLLVLRKSQSGYDVSTGSGQTLQQTPKIPGSAEIMRNQVTEPIVAYLLLRYLFEILPLSAILYKSYNIPLLRPL